jgi:hypothetical protein
MTWETVRFEPVTWTFIKNVPCASCGKKIRRQKTLEQTLSPYNRHLGLPKTRERIIEELKEEGAAWEMEQETCRRCQL